MNTKTLQAFAKVQAQIKELEGKRDGLKVEIMAEMEKNKTSKLETTFGKFTIGSHASWTYSEKVESLVEKVKLQQIKEQETGKATKSETQYLLFTIKKN